MKITMYKTIADVDMADKRSLQRYEDYMRQRLKQFGYRIVKRKTIQPGADSTSKERGFCIVSMDTNAVVTGENYELSLGDVESFWMREHEERNADKQERKFQRQLKKLNAIQLDGGWIVTNDARALQALKDHIAQYGEFDADGHGAGGDIASVMYRAYRPWFCPKFSQVWPIDGNWSNLTDCNLRSDADETDFSDGIVPITTQRRIWHDEYRIAIKLPIRNQIFFTDYSPERFQILCNKALHSWYG